MSDSAMTAPSNALAAKQAQEKSYRKKGIDVYKRQTQGCVNV